MSVIYNVIKIGRSLSAQKNFVKQQWMIFLKFQNYNKRKTKLLETQDWKQLVLKCSRKFWKFDAQNIVVLPQEKQCLLNEAAKLLGGKSFERNLFLRTEC